ncbi:hypothetical protein D3C74_449730 [compost metagenome]
MFLRLLQLLSALGEQAHFGGERKDCRTVCSGICVMLVIAFPIHIIVMLTGKPGNPAVHRFLLLCLFCGRLARLLRFRFHFPLAEGAFPPHNILQA